MMIQSGFAITDITPPVGACIPGGFSPIVSTGINDPLRVRAAVICDDTTALALVGVDAVSLSTEDVLQARQQAEALCAIPAASIIIAASHTHTGGSANDVLGTPSDTHYRQHIVQQIASAIALAHARRVPCELGWGVGEASGLAWNRRWVLKDGRHATHADPSNEEVIGRAGPDDPQVVLLAARDLDGHVLGFVGNFACHCTLRGGRAFSADYPGAWNDQLERFTGAPLVFLNGAMGDVTQINRDAGFAYPQKGEPVIRRFAHKLTGESLKLLADMHFTGDASLTIATEIIEMPFRVPDAIQLAQDRKMLEAAAPSDHSRDVVFARERLLLQEYIEQHGTARCEVICMRIGDLAITSSPGQMFCSFGLDMKKQSPFSATMVVSLANGNIGYVPTAEAIAKGGYEPTLCRGSRSVPEAGDRIVAVSSRLLRKLA
jgi:neutral ceramidase